MDDCGGCTAVTGSGAEGFLGAIFFVLTGILLVTASSGLSVFMFSFQVIIYM